MNGHRRQFPEQNTNSTGIKSNHPLMETYEIEMLRASGLAARVPKVGSVAAERPVGGVLKAVGGVPVPPDLQVTLSLERVTQSTR